MLRLNPLKRFSSPCLSFLAKLLLQKFGNRIEAFNDIQSLDSSATKICTKPPERHADQRGSTSIRRGKKKSKCFCLAGGTAIFFWQVSINKPKPKVPKSPLELRVLNSFAKKLEIILNTNPSSGSFASQMAACLSICHDINFFY